MFLVYISEGRALLIRFVVAKKFFARDFLIEVKSCKIERCGMMVIILL